MVAVVKKRSLIIKQEATRGTFVDPADADFDIPFMDITYTAEKSTTEGKYATGDFDTYPAIMGTSRGTITASTYLWHSGTSATPPTVSKALGMLGLRQTINAGTSVVYDALANYELGPNDLSYSCVIQDPMAGNSANAKHVRFAGCLASGKVVMEEIGKPWRLDLEIQGKFVGEVDIANVNILNDTGLDTTVPNSIKAATITEASVAQQISTFEFDIGNVIELENDPSDVTGFKAAVITDRNPVLNYDPMIDLLANDASYTRWNAGTESAVAISSDNWAFAAPSAQIISMADATQGNQLAYQKSLRLNRNNGNDAWTLTHT